MKHLKFTFKKAKIFAFIFLGLVFLLIKHCAVLKSFELKFFDLKTKFTAHFFRPDDDICFIGVDQASLDWVREELGFGWPWPRSLYGQIADYIGSSANSLIFDILFTEDSVYGKDDDLEFGKACSRNNNIINTMYFSSRISKRTLLPVPDIAENSAMIGSSVSSKDKDDVIRRAKLLCSSDGQDFVTLGLCPLVLGKKIDIDAIPCQKDGTITLRYKGELERYAHYSAWEILESIRNIGLGKEPLIEPENFEGADVFFLLYSPGLFDICSTSINKVYPGAGVHITLLDNIKNNDFIKPVSEIIEYFMIILAVLLGFLCIFEFRFKSKYYSQMLFMCLCIVCVIYISAIINICVFIYGYNLGYVNFISAFIVSVFCNLIIIYIFEGKQKNFIKTAFNHYLSSTVIEEILKNPEKLKLGGEKRNISIFFSDLQNFTSLSESITPIELINFLNEYLSDMSEIILKHGGTIDKYEGDAIIAFWNAPLEQKNHGELAVRAAMECQKKIREKQSKYLKMTGVKIKTRIGVNTGEAIVGNIGSNIRFDYSMIGDNVNLASRLEGLNKFFGTFIICSEATKLSFEQTCDVLEWRELGKVAVVGKKDAVKVFEPMDNSLEFIDDYNFALKKFYEGDFSGAKEIFSSLKEKDCVSARYVKECDYHLSCVNENWDGVIVAKEK